jgi:hypothetical protein
MVFNRFGEPGLFGILGDVLTIQMSFNSHNSRFYFSCTA